MKFLLAPDSFKESLSAKEVAEAMETGLRKVFPDAEYIKIPMADGGEGTTQALVDASGGQIFYPLVKDPLGNKVEGKLGILGNGHLAVLEMASASGLELVPSDKRNPLITTSFGTGQLIRAALDKKVKNIIIGLGGSATNDGGAGMLQALGARLIDKDGKNISYGGGALKDLVKIDVSCLDPRIKDTKIEVACDVDNPLTGKNGASHIFGPQKGATEDMVISLDRNLKHFARIIKRDLGRGIENMPGAGAAGGLGGALVAFLNAELFKGVDLVVKYTQIEKHMKDADIVFTGEGSIDAQTRYGKTPYGVAKLAKKHKIPLIALGGVVSKDAVVLYDYGFDAIFSIISKISNLEDALEDAKENIEITCQNIARLIRIKS